MPTWTDRAAWIPSAVPRRVDQRVIGARQRQGRDEHRERRHVERSRRNASSSVQSTVRNVVTCGIAATSVSRLAISRRTAVMGSTPATSDHRPTGGVQVLDRDPSAGARCRRSSRGRSPVPSRACGPPAWPRAFAEAGASTADGGATGGRIPSATCERHQRRADRDRVAHRAVQRRDAAGERRRDLDRRLRRLHLDERLVQRDLVAGGDQPRDDLALLQPLAQVRHGEHALGHQYFTVRRTASAMRSTLGR